jgi:hypothetical protein
LFARPLDELFINYKKQRLYLYILNILALEKVIRFRYTEVAVDSLSGNLQIGTSAKSIRPSHLASHQELIGRKLGVKQSSPRLAARDGMEQEPYEF